MGTKDRSPNQHARTGGPPSHRLDQPSGRFYPQRLPKVAAKVVSVDEDVYASNGMSMELVPAALPSTILFSDAPPLRPYVQLCHGGPTHYPRPLLRTPRDSGEAKRGGRPGPLAFGPDRRFTTHTYSPCTTVGCCGFINTSARPPRCTRWRGLLEYPGEGAGALHDESSIVSCRRGGLSRSTRPRP